jgi:zinc transporter
MQRLMLERVPWLSDLDRVRLREQTDRVMRYVEDLDAARDRAGVTQEELAGKLSEQMNNRMYVLSVIAGIFLPISFVTGLLGVNVGGIPGPENPWAFTVLTLLLVVITVVELLIFKHKRWL